MAEIIGKYEYWNSKLLALSPQQYEEICWELIKALGFVNLNWAGLGGSDKGRDIVAEKIETKVGVTTITEKWFFQCKRYGSGISPEAISPAIDWAKAEKPDYFVIMSNSHLTQGCRDYIDKVQQQVQFKIIPWTDKNFQNTILFRFPNIVQSFFPDEKLPELEKSETPQKILELTFRVPADVKKRMDKKISEITKLQEKDRVNAIFDVIEKEIFNAINDYNIKALLYQQFALFTTDTKQKIYFLDKALTITADNPLVLMNKALILVEGGMYKEALECLDIILKADKYNKFAWNNKGHIFALQKRFIPANTCFEKAISIDPKFILVRDNKGAILENQEKYMEAMKVYNETLRLFPDSKTTLNRKCMLLLNSKDYKRAFELVEKVLEIDPNFVEALNNKGVIAQRLGRYYRNEKEKYYKYNEFALNIFDKTTKINDKFTVGHSNKIVCLMNLDRISDATKTANENLEKFPKNPLVINNKARLLMKDNKLDDTEKLISDALKISPKSKEILITQCSLFHRNKKLKKALGMVEELLKSYPKEEEIWKLKGDILNDMGKNDKASKCYARAEEYFKPLSLIDIF